MFYVSPARVFLVGDPASPISGFYMQFRVPEGKENMQVLEKSWRRGVRDFDDNEKWTSRAVEAGQEPRCVEVVGRGLEN